jgi:putative addiction module killer protein
MIEVRQTAAFRTWIGALRDLRDLRAVARIDARIGRFRLGNFGDVKSVGDGVSEMRVDFGPGYRVYLMRQGDRVVVLLCAGDKSSQARDIRIAKAMAAEMKG